MFLFCDKETGVKAEESNVLQRNYHEMGSVTILPFRFLKADRCKLYELKQSLELRLAPVKKSRSEISRSHMSIHTCII